MNIKQRKRRRALARSVAGRKLSDLTLAERDFIKRAWNKSYNQ